MFSILGSNLTSFVEDLRADQSQTLLISITNEFTPAMDTLRMLCFPKDVHEMNKEGRFYLTSQDEFDDRSHHVTIQTRKHEVIAYCRLTAGPDGVFKAWSRGKLNIETQGKSIDWGRLAIRPDFRGGILYNSSNEYSQFKEKEVSLFDVITRIVIQYAKENEYTQIIAGFALGRNVGNRLYKHGFMDIGLPVDMAPLGKNAVLIQPIIYEITQLTKDNFALIKQYLNIIHQQKYDSQQLRSNL